MEPPGGKACATRLHVTTHPVFWVFDEPPRGDEHPLSDASQFGSILVFWGFWVDSIRGEKIVPTVWKWFEARIRWSI